MIPGTPDRSGAHWTSNSRPVFEIWTGAFLLLELNWSGAPPDQAPR
jgi:hypothetical protein